MGRQPPTGLDPGEIGQLPTLMIENPPPKKNTATKASQVPRFAQLTLHKLNPIAFGLTNSVRSEGYSGFSSTHWLQALGKDYRSSLQSESVLGVLLLQILGHKLI